MQNASGLEQKPKSVTSSPWICSSVRVRRGVVSLSEQRGMMESKQGDIASILFITLTDFEVQGSAVSQSKNWRIVILKASSESCFMVQAVFLFIPIGFLFL